MKDQLPQLINIPPFIQRIHSNQSKSGISKILLIIKGKITQILIKYVEGKLFCVLMNYLYKEHSRIGFQNNLYFKKINDEILVHYPNKRITRAINRENYIFHNLFDSYCLNDIEFQKGDLVIDCGANVGELNIAFNLKGLEIEYLGVEPESKTFICLEKNKMRESDKFLNLALSNISSEERLYLDSLGGNSSIVYFGNDDFEIIKTQTLDSLSIQKEIKLFKLEAEGFEPEILEGGLSTLKKIKFIAVDFGSERGLDEENTVVKVNNLLYSNNFSLVSFSDYRYIGLYKNNNLK